MQIDEYVKSTRRLKGTPAAAAWYERIYRSICRRTSLLPSEAPILTVTYSTSRSCETLILNDKTYIVYDQYLGQGMNMLNRIYLNSTSKTDAKMFACKVLAEQLHVSGYPELAFISALSYSKLKGELDSYKTDLDLRKRATLTLVQECFVLAHELAHVLLSRDEGFTPMVEAKRDLLRTDLNRRVDMSELADEFLSDMHSAFEMDGSYRDHMSQEQITRFQEDYERKSEKIYDDFDVISRRDDIVEECLCDEWATRITVGAMAEDYNVRLTDSLLGILLGLHNLRLIAAVTRQAKDLANTTDNDFGDYLLESLVRTTSWRRTVVSVLAIGHSRYARRMHKVFVSANRRYAEIIQDPILFDLGERLEIVKRQFGGHDAPSILPQPKINKLIDAL